MRIGAKEFHTKEKTYVMGILNVTPDSFSDGGKYQDMEAVLSHAEEMIRYGAAIIDVGGESTRPGYERITDEEEINRVVPVIRAIKERFDIPVSVDTYKSKVAKAAIEAGADMINDIWGLKADSDMAKVIADSGVACCLMHNRTDTEYHNFLHDLLRDLRESVDIALKAGIRDDKIILDPGVGFAKTYEQNLLAIKHMGRLKDIGYPILLGTSRKSVIGLTLDLPSDDRLEGTIATTVLGVREGVSFVRVHDVKENYRAILMAEKILNAR